MTRLEAIVRACGGDLFDGGRRALIPGPGHSPRDRSVSLIEGDNGYIFVSCFSPKDDWRDVRRQLEERGLLGDETERKGSPSDWTGAKTSAARSGERLARARRFWAQATAIRATPAEKYLIARALPAIVAQSSALRFHAQMTSLEDRARRPALLSAIRSSDGAFQGVEITLLTSDGLHKAPLETPRRVVGRLLGGAIRLSEPVDDLLIGEGMETTASAASAFGAPAWALLSARNLSLFSPPRRLKRLIVATDNDAAGRLAFERLRRRLPKSLDVECALPPSEHNDWNDFARAQR